MEGAGQRAQSQLCSVSPEAHAQRNILRYLHRVLIIQKFAKRVDLTLSSYLTHTHTHKLEGGRILWEVTGVGAFTAQMGVLVSGMYTYLQTH